MINYTNVYCWITALRKFIFLKEIILKDDFLLYYDGLVCINIMLLDICLWNSYMILNAFFYRNWDLLFFLNIPGIVHFKEIHVDFSVFPRFIQILRVSSLS